MRARVAGVVSVLCGLIALRPGLATAKPLAGVSPDPQTIFGGVDADTCDFPSAVGMLDRDSGQLFCTGTLVAPSVVVFAAHCMDPQTSWATPGSVMFGEDVSDPAREIPVVDCAVHPQWDAFLTSFDLAACRLAEPVTEVPPTPLIMGCEVELLQPGAQVIIVGFGASSAIVDDQGNPISSGAGTKRFIDQTVTSVSLVDNEVVMIGPDKGGCFGDSGGPALLRMPDETWRVIGAASTLHPEAAPDQNGEICGLGTVYEIFWPHMDWLEALVAADVTPCFDTAGNWQPTPACGGFSKNPLGGGTWGDGCATGEPGAWSATCGPPFSEAPFPGPPPPEPPPPEPPPPEPFPEPEPEPPPPEPFPEPPSPEPSPEPPRPPPQSPRPLPEAPLPEPADPDEDASSDESSVGAEDDGLADRGCSCAQGQDVSWNSSWLLLALLGLGRRRRGRSNRDRRSA